MAAFKDKVTHTAWNKYSGYVFIKVQQGYELFCKYTSVKQFGTRGN